MPIDPNIALGVRPIEQPNMLAQMGQVMALRQAQQEYENEGGLRNALTSGATEDPSSLLQYGKSGRATYESILKGKKEQLESSQKRIDMMGGLAGFVRERPTPENFESSLNQAVSYGLMTPAQKQAVITQYGGSPESIRAYADQTFQGALTAKDRTANETRLEASRISAAPGHRQASIAEQRFAADQAPLSIDDATVDLVANRYLIDGTLPPLGMGKPAAMLRAKILDRAQAIATAPSSNKPNVNAMTEPQPVAPVVAPVAGAAPIVPVGGAVPVATPATPTATPASVGVTPQQAAQNIVTSKTNTATQKRALTDFSTGIQGRMVNSMNTAVEHLSTLTELADALKNNDVRAINTVGNLVAKQTGSPAPTNFAAARQIVAQEIVKAIVANGGTGREREEAAANIAAAGSPEQLAGVISTYQELLAGQLKSLGLQYKNTTGRDDFNTKLLPSTLRALSRVESAAPAKTGDITSDAGIAKVIKSNAEYDALPSGTTFTAPDGSIRRKP